MNIKVCYFLMTDSLLHALVLKTKNWEILMFAVIEGKEIKTHFYYFQQNARGDRKQKLERVSFKNFIRECIKHSPKGIYYFQLL